MLQIISYSAKAIAVIGDTKEFAPELKKLGGRFNFRLSCGAGWIFPKSAETKVRALAAGEPLKADNPLEGARVYVGTYAKYNNGSIAGAWLDLKDYKDKGEFLRACAELHKDESDPEFMFQDWEGVPSWMIGESHISDEVWQQEPEAEIKGEQSKAEIAAILQRTLPERLKGEAEERARNIARIVEVEGRYFPIAKPSIETRFCHPDEPEDIAREWLKNCRTYDYFRGENMEGLLDKIQTLENEATGSLADLFIYRESYDNSWKWGYNSARYYLTQDSEETPMSEETRKALIKAYRAVAKTFEKRLATWWKRYGADKLHCWTYWADR